jgi:Ca2+/H+ antiporter
LLSDATEEVSEHSGPTIGAIFTAAFGIFIVNFVNIDAKSNWLEGVLLLGMFAIFGAAFFYYPADCDRLFKSGDIASISLFWVQVDSVIFG